MERNFGLRYLSSLQENMLTKFDVCAYLIILVVGNFNFTLWGHLIIFFFFFFFFLNLFYSTFEAKLEY
jgi:hypothetical protein